jgi:glycosyltransferase involved in cell wall biosynthesis
MKILIICDRLDSRGGLENYVLSQVDGLLKRGHEVMLSVNAITEYNLSLIEHKDKFHLKCPWGYPWDRVMEDIDDFVPDVIHVHPFSAIARGVIVSKTLCKPLYVTMHGLYGHPLDNTDIANQVKRVIAVDHCCEKIIKSHTTCGDRLEVIYNCIDMNEFYKYQPNIFSIYELYNNLQINKNWRTLGIITRLDDGKDVPALQTTNILNNLADNLGGLNVLYVGGGTKIDVIKSGVINSLNINKDNLNVQIVGSVSNVADYMNICDFICASARTAVEAIACGKNVLQMGICRWGVLVDENNYKDTLFDTTYYRAYTDIELADCLTDCLKNKINPNDSLINIIRDKCNIEHMIDRLEEIYKG